MPSSESSPRGVLALTADRGAMEAGGRGVGHGSGVLVFEFADDPAQGNLRLLVFPDGPGGLPWRTWSGSRTLAVTPLFAAILLPSAMRMWPLMPTCPPIMQRAPISVDPAMPVWAAMTVWSPMRTLWATWMRLSSLTPWPRTVDPSVARSMVVPAPISHPSPRTTLPSCGTFSYPDPSGQTKAVGAHDGAGLEDAVEADHGVRSTSTNMGRCGCPSRCGRPAPQWRRTQTQPEPMEAPAPMWQRAPMVTPASMRASGWTTALGSMVPWPFCSSEEGEKVCMSLAMAAYGSFTRIRAVPGCSGLSRRSSATRTGGCRGGVSGVRRPGWPGRSIGPSRPPRCRQSRSGVNARVAFQTTIQQGCHITDVHLHGSKLPRTLRLTGMFTLHRRH